MARDATSPIRRPVPGLKPGAAATRSSHGPAALRIGRAPGTIVKKEA
jgi:hypothetical protein